MINRYYNADHFQVNASLACSRDTFIIIRILVLFFFYQSDFVLDFLAFPSLLLVALTLGSGASVSRMLMVGTILGLVPLDEEIKAEMKYIIPKGFFSLFLHSNMLTSKNTMLNFTTPSFFTRSLSILWFLKHFLKNNKILSLLFGFFPPDLQNDMSYMYDKYLMFISFRYWLQQLVLLCKASVQ